MVKSKKTSGFTIVELLIVIVVIGILAAITIVAYNGIQARARNSQTTSAVQAYYKALVLYMTDKGSYPIQNDACLGQNYPNNKCWQSYTTTASTTLDAALAPYLNNNPPNPSTKMMMIGTAYNQYRGGIMFQYNSAKTLDGKPAPYALSYYLEGNVPCTVGPVVSPGLSSTPPANNQTEFFSGAEGPQCVISLPNPS
jgi:general secretion pathway protein G